MTEAIYQFDYAVLNFIQEHLTGAFWDVFFPIYTQLGKGGILCILVGAVMLWFPKTRKMGMIIAFSLMLGTVLTNATLKPIVARVRPYLNYEWNPLRTIGGDSEFAGSLKLLIKAERDYSFPSGHTTACVETACAIFSCRKKWGCVAIAMALLVGYSRLYLYMHYCTDVIGGILVGVLAAVAGYFLAKFIWPKLPRYMREDSVFSVCRQFFRKKEKKA